MIDHNGHVQPRFYRVFNFHIVMVLNACQKHHNDPDYIARIVKMLFQHIKMLDAYQSHYQDP